MIYGLNAKSKNRRVQLFVFKSPDGVICYHIRTKRLVDFKTRYIIKTDNVYSYETFRIMLEVMNILFMNPEFEKLVDNDEKMMSKDVVIQTNLNDVK